MQASIQQQKNDKQYRVAGYLGTVIAHALILLGLWFLVLMPPNPPLGGGGPGMSISLGEEGMGGPNEFPVEEIVPVEVPPETPKDEEALATQDAEDAPVVEEKKEKVTKPEKKPDVVKPVEKPIEKPVETKPVVVERKPDQRSLFTKKTATATSAGSGDGSAPGNEGRPDGDPNGSPDGNGGTGNGGSGGGTGTGNGPGNGPGSGPGSGGGDGIGGYELSGRALVQRPAIEDNSRETGKVVVGIVVDRSGKVLKATPGQKGSTTLSPVLLEKAKQGALNGKFSAKADGPEEQYGTITFIFRFKP